MFWGSPFLTGQWPASAVAQPAGGQPASYTLAQASVGQPAYDQHCATCHGGGREGGGITPSLTGERFAVQVRGQAVGLLWSQMLRMPPDYPGVLSGDIYANILAYMLQHNGPTYGSKPSKRAGLRRIIVSMSASLIPSPRRPSMKALRPSVCSGFIS